MTAHDASLGAAVSTGPAEADGFAPTGQDFPGSEIEVEFIDPRGFLPGHADRFARAVQAYPGKVTLVVKRREAEANRPSHILALGIATGDTIRIRAHGDDETDTLSALAALIGEFNNEPQAKGPGAPIAASWTPNDPQNLTIFKGAMAAPGLALAPTWKWEPAVLADRKRTTGDTDTEIAALKTAILTAKKQLLALTEGNPNPIQHAIFEVHASLVEDELVFNDAIALIRDGHDALSAWDAIILSRAQKLASLNDPHLAQRADDIHDVGQRVRRILLGVDHDPLGSVSGPVILVADDLEPSQAAQLRVEQIRGICLKNGSPNSHAAIVSRSLGIPMLVAIGPDLDRLPIGETAILDASGGRVIPHPSAADLASAEAAIREVKHQHDLDWEHRFEPATLRDGRRVEVVANIGQPAEARAVVESGAEGVGLLRTEFLFLDRDHAPDEEEQYQAMREMIEALQGLPMIVRTLDIGGDKPVSYLGLSELDLSFLGLRGFRLSQARPDLATTQLRAIFRAAEHGPIRLMFPMIATPNDFLRAREMTEKVRREMGGKKIELGAMIEVPSAVVMAPELAELADFFSVGTNDLTQYTLAIDRTHPLLARRADSLHPSVLRLIRDTVRAAHDKGKWVGVCGGLAADPLGALILTGLGVDELSMPPALVPQIKALLRREDSVQLAELAARALRQRDARAVRALRPAR